MVEIPRAKKKSIHADNFYIFQSHIPALWNMAAIKKKTEDDNSKQGWFLRLHNFKAYRWSCVCMNVCALHGCLSW